MLFCYYHHNITKSYDFVIIWRVTFLCPSVGPWSVCLFVCKRGVKLHFHAPIRALPILQIIILRLLFSSCPIHIFIVIIIIIIKMTTNNMAVNTSHSFSLLPIVFTFWPIIFRCVAFLLIDLFSIIKFTMVFIINHHWHISLLKCKKYYIN